MYIVTQIEKSIDKNINFPRCPKCSGKLEKEKEIDYPYVCLNCDENFYEFESMKDD